MSIEGQGHFFTKYFSGFVCFVLYLDKISGERLQDHWSSGLFYYYKGIMVKSGNVVPCKYVSASSLAPNLIRKFIFFL